MKGQGVIKPGGNFSGCERLRVDSFEVSSTWGSFVVEDLLPKNLFINLFPPCLIVDVPEIEDVLEETLGRSIASLGHVDAIVVAYSLYFTLTIQNGPKWVVDKTHLEW